MSTALCIGCGCHEHAACQFDGMHVAPTCWWLRLDGRKGVGLCSSCEDLTKHWDSGGHALLPEIIVERYWRQAMFLYGDEASAKAWIEAPQPLLGDRSPRELILAGELERVHQVLEQLRGEVFVWDLYR